MKGRFKWVVVGGVLLTLSIVGSALAQPPVPTTPAPQVSPTPPGGSWDDMRDWMDGTWGEGFFDQMHGSWEGMLDACDTMMGSDGGGMGSGMMGGYGGGMMGSGGSNSQRGGSMMGGLGRGFGSGMMRIPSWY